MTRTVQQYIQDEFAAGSRPHPTQVRSMAAALYQQAGRDRGEVAALMAHTSEHMTAYYQDDRRRHFLTGRAGLRLAKPDERQFVLC